MALVIKYLGKEPKIDPTAVIFPNAMLIGDVEVGSESSIWPYSVLRGDRGKITLGSQVNFQDHCVAHGTVKIGNRVGVAHNSVLHDCEIEDDVLVGIGSVILDGARVGSFSIIGAGSVVTEKTVIPPNSLAVGVPAKVIKKTTEELINRIKDNVRLYLELSQNHDIPGKSGT